MRRELENDIVKFWIDEGILFSEFKTEIVMTLENAKKIIDLRHQISSNEKQYWCFFTNGLKSYEKQGRDYSDVHGQDFLYATALIVHSNITMFMFNVYIKIKNVKIPFKVFTNKEKAVEWLNDIKTQNEKSQENKHKLVLETSPNQNERV